MVPAATQWLCRINEQPIKEERRAPDQPSCGDGGDLMGLEGTPSDALRRVDESVLQTRQLMAQSRTTRDIVAKLWNLCHILRDDGVTYHEYLMELTFLLFLKMMEETGRENILPAGFRWSRLKKQTGSEQLAFYKRLLLALGASAQGEVAAIFADAQTSLRKPANLTALATAIDALDWFCAREEGLGKLYEGLLEKNAAEKKSGAGQYFTPRPLVDCVVRLLKPQPGETIQDPAAGTGGFLIAADRYIKDHADALCELAPGQTDRKRRAVFIGLELVPDTHRLCLMNLMLHGIDGNVKSGDALSADGAALARADLVLTNPPFGAKKGAGAAKRADLSITAETSNKQLAFVEHIVRALRPGGRAAFVVPDNVLFEDHVGRRLRTWMMDLCAVHTILRLPTGIFYAPGIKTNLMFLVRGLADRANTQAIWVYDLRHQIGPFGRNRDLSLTDFEEFETAFGGDPYGTANRTDQGPTGRFRCFTREQISARNDNLDLSWLRDSEGEAEEHLRKPEDLAAAVTGHLRAALAEIEAVSEEFKELSTTPDRGQDAA
jgi:type I restriction enzyme M protein